jgi:hypothetical protein
MALYLLFQWEFTPSPVQAQANESGKGVAELEKQRAELVEKIAKIDAALKILKAEKLPQSAPGDLLPIEGVGAATLRGKIVFDGDPPERKSLAGAIKGHADAKACAGGDLLDPLWIVGPDKGVANVVVWLKAPKGTYLRACTPITLTKEVVIMDQPHCAYEPHVAAFWPSYYDLVAKRQRKTGQEFHVLNSAIINHNTSWYGNRLVNPGDNRILPPKGTLNVDAVSCRGETAGGEDLLTLSCDIHKWMSAKVAVFDHPYFAVTDRRGEFQIERIPVGVELTLAYWHESMDPRSLEGATKLPINLNLGVNEKNLKLRSVSQR